MKIINIFAILIISSIGFAQDNLKVMQYNLLNYGNITSYCTVSNNSMLDKEPLLREIIQYIQPDIFAVNELGANSFVVGRILDSVMNNNSAIVYDKADYVNTNGSNLINMLYFNTAKLVYVSAESIQNNVRDIVLYRLYYNSPNIAQDHDTAWVNCIVGHLKAGSGTSDKNTRAAMTSSAMTYLVQHNYKGNYMFMGDFNVYKSSEQAYQNLINYSNLEYRFHDPINHPGNWNNSSSHASVHTQSTHSSSNGCASGGGLDDRFDFILISKDIKYGNKHINFKSGSYKVIGNDGNHFNKSINNGTNTSAPANIISALYNHSDHLPVVLELEVDAQVSGIVKNENSQIKINYQNPINGIFDLHITSKIEMDLSIEIWNIAGQRIYTNNIKGENMHLQIPFNNFAKGMYILQVKNTKGQLEYNSKLINL